MVCMHAFQSLLFTTLGVESPSGAGIPPQQVEILEQRSGISGIRLPYIAISMQATDTLAQEHPSRIDRLPVV